MHKFLLLTTAALSIANWEAKAQTDLSAYADANGYLDVQKLTCAQLAGTWQEDADMLMTWYSGWYNGLAKKHFFHTSRAKRLEHEVIVYCKANLGIRMIDAIAVIFKDERARQGIQKKKNEGVDPRNDGQREQSGETATPVAAQTAQQDNRKEGQAP